MPSQAAAPTLPWPSAANPAASAIPKPEAIATQFVAGAAAPPCAYAGIVIIIMASTENTPIVSFRIVFLLMNRCQWVVDAVPCRRPHARSKLLVLVRHSLADIHRRQQHEDVCLNE